MSPKVSDELRDRLVALIAEARLKPNEARILLNTSLMVITPQTTDTDEALAPQRPSTRASSGLS